jgi:probable HAF family extracellular repeat protein
MIRIAGDVIGCSKGPAGSRAFLWTKARGIQDLGALPGGDMSEALAINDSQEVVGTAASAAGERAFIWTKQTGMVDLNNPDSAQLGIVFIEAHGINNKGEILAMGEPGDGTGSAHGDRCAPAPRQVLSSRLHRKSRQRGALRRRRSTVCPIAFRGPPPSPAFLFSRGFPP